MSLIEIKNVSYGYSHGTPFEIKALDNININIEKGEFLGIIGHTGSGKSTLMQMLNGLLKPDTGEIIFDGKNVNENKQITRDTRFRVGLCFQYPEYQLFEETCEKDISFGPSNMNLSEDEIKERVLFACNITGFSTELLERSPFDLSGGQKRRCAIAGVIAMKPEVLIMDEPSAGLDPKGKKDIYKMIKKYKASTGATVIVVSHSMEEIAELADRIVVMNKGSVFLNGTVKEVFSNAVELKKIGLDIPVATNLLIRLKEVGYQLSTDIYTVNEAVTEIMNCLKEGKN